MIKLILGILAVALLSSALGIGHGYLVSGKIIAEREKLAAELDKKALPPPPCLRELKPIVTNLAAPAGYWVRLESGLICDGNNPPSEKLLNEISDDIVAYLRTSTANQLEGGAGLRRLRADLNERLAIRANYNDMQVLVQTLVVQ